MALFRYIYGIPYEYLHEGSETEWQFLANVYIAANKYEVQGLTAHVTRRMKRALPEDGNLESSTDDFLAAVKLIFDNTTSENDIGREAMVDLCVCCITCLRELRKFEALLSECDGLSAKILTHEKLSLMFEGTWLCGRDEEEYKGAEPCCSYCKNEFPTSYVRANRHKSVWGCSACGLEVRPVCTEHHHTMVYECNCASASGRSDNGPA